MSESGMHISSEEAGFKIPEYEQLEFEPGMGRTEDIPKAEEFTDDQTEDLYYRQKELIDEITFCEDEEQRKRLAKELKEITYRKNYMEKDARHALSELSANDPLTNAATRRVFNQQFEAVDKGLAERPEVERREVVTIGFVDMDDFKKVNDTYGHDGGDQVLVKTVEILKEFLRPEDLVARVGGDEFAFIARGLTKEMAEERVTKFQNALSERPVSLTHQETKQTIDFYIGSSVGIATTSELQIGERGKDLLARADNEMYKNKKDKKKEDPGVNVEN